MKNRLVQRIFSALVAFVLTFAVFAPTAVSASETPHIWAGFRVSTDSYHLYVPVSFYRDGVFVETITTTGGTPADFYTEVPGTYTARLHPIPGYVIYSVTSEGVLRGPEQVVTVGTFDGTNTVHTFVFWTVRPGDTPTPPQVPQPQPQQELPSAWAVPFIEQAIELGLVPQELQSRYTQHITRAEFSALAVALYETVTGREITGRLDIFRDTNDINVQKMAYLRVVSGIDVGVFAPNDAINRAQAAVMLARLANAIGQPLPLSAPTFVDVGHFDVGIPVTAGIYHWAFEAIGQVQAAGVMSGVGDNQFEPWNDYTREQSIVTMLRLFEILN